MKYTIFLLIIAPFLFAETVQQIIPTTINNIQGQKVLFNEGYYVIPSSRKALDYAYKNAIETPRLIWEEISRIRIERNKRTASLKINQEKLDSEDDQKFEKYLLENKNYFISSVEKNAEKMNSEARESRKQAFEKFTLGYFEFSKNTAEDVTTLKKVKSDWFKNLRDDFKESDQIFLEINQKSDVESLAVFQKSFQDATNEIQHEYRNSKSRENSLLGLFDISFGYLKALYYGALEPAAKVSVLGGLKTFYFFTNSAVASIKTFFYTSNLGYKIIAPSIESGYLSALSLIQWSAAKTISATGQTIYSLQQIAVVGAKPAYIGGRWIISTSADTAENSVLAIYDYSSAAAEISINQIKAGAVLGANAITALPAQALLSAANSAVFLVYDGPRLVLYAVRGKINATDIADAPVGTVMDINQLEKAGLKTQRIDAAPEEIKKIIIESVKGK